MTFDETLHLLYSKGVTVDGNYLVMDGDLNLSNTGIKELPDNLVIGGSLYLGNTLIIRLPENIKVGLSLSLWNTPITNIPDGIEIKGTLSLRFCGNIKQVPPTIKVGTCLDLRDSGIKRNTFIKPSGVIGNVYVCD